MAARNLNRVIVKSLPFGGSWVIIAWLDNLASVFSAVSACAQENPLRAQVPCLKTFAKQHFVKVREKRASSEVGLGLTI